MKSNLVCIFHYNGPWYWQLGFHIFLPAPNIEIHIPFGFIRIGWESKGITWEETAHIKDFGYQKGKWQIRKYKDGYDW